MNHHKQGFTLLELIITVALIGLIGSMTLPFLARFMERLTRESTTDQLVHAIYKSQQYAMDGKGNGVWGVCVVAQTVRFYQDSCATPITSEEITIPESITISGLTDISFTNRRGELLSPVTITLTTETDTETITINQAGGITRL